MKQARMYSNISRRSGTSRPGVHNIVTEAQTLDEALDIVSARNRKAALKRAQNTPRTLKQEFALARGQARLKPISLAGGTKPKDSRFKRQKTTLPHPFKSLTDQQKRDKVREMFMTGLWGDGSLTYYKLSRVFGVTKGQIVEWLDGARAPL